MNKIKLASFSSLLVASMASAGNSCDKFEIMIKNETGDLLTTTAELGQGAVITPHISTDIHKQQVFTIDATNAQDIMSGKFHLRSASVPMKEVIIHYTLKNDTTTCTHTEIPAESQNYSVVKSRPINQVVYTISPKK